MSDNNKKDNEVEKNVKQSTKNLNQLFNNIPISSFNKKFISGTASGWCTGMIVSKVGKSVALVVGSGILLFQIAHHNGYIKSDWKDLKERAEKRTGDLDLGCSKTCPVMVDKVTTFASKHKVFTAGFIGGFFLGIAF